MRVLDHAIDADVLRQLHRTTLRDCASA